ncbi:Phospholipase D precursor [Tsuneonella dongtanensis]|uniref:Phospholipase D n=1 Tax=Tsuneonella dongtanensis TaxID=692370 RepID=A0A1B2A9P1_9SPHN|nr:alkaline phosphatase D family protein [Tsuneonella dongtanensis]ANY18903.1 Phospholipase D precursor [Tsuneonella dongtanensis]
MTTRMPPPAVGIPALSRRALLGGGLLGFGLAAAPLAAQVGAGFTHGVASGEPSAKSVLLWTRFVGRRAARLRWEVSESAEFTRIASGGTVRATPANDWCAKAVATGLAPGRWYHYRFVAPDGTMSATGRTRTLPDGPTARFRMAVFSCSNIGFGHFNGYAHAAAADEFELAVHLGDYLYEYERNQYPIEKEIVDGRVPDPTGEIVALADYRMRYASYRRDPDLVRLHQLYPMISVYDDHESANDSWKGGAENHDPATEGPWSARKRAAMKARSEWLPVSDDPWARYDIGDLASIFRIETRLTARDKPLDLAGATKGLSPEDADAALRALREGTWADPKRTLMGRAQEQWLSAGLRSSVRSGRKWQVLAQQVIMGGLSTPSDIAERVGNTVPDYVKRRLVAAVAASRAGLPASMDTWDGYPAARSRLLASALDAGANLVTLTGDSHNAWAFDLAHGGDAAGVEFAGQSVTSPGFESSFRQTAPKDLAALLVGHNPGLKWCDTSNRGYMAVELTPQAATCEWRFSDPVRNRSAALAGAHRLVAAHGARRLTSV